MHIRVQVFTPSAMRRLYNEFGVKYPDPKVQYHLPFLRMICCSRPETSVGGPALFSQLKTSLFKIHVYVSVHVLLHLLAISILPL